MATSIRTGWAHYNAVEGIRDQWNKLVRLGYAGDSGDFLGSDPEADVDAPLGIIKKGDPLPRLKPPSEREGILSAAAEAADGDGDGPTSTPLQVKVGIVGAGAAGLFTALTLDYLNTAQKSVVFTYEILEADPVRSGGRLFTYHFSGQGHDYFDVGAMRFPDHPIMTRTFDLFRTLGGMWPPGQLDPNGDVNKDPPAGKLIPYYMTNIDPDTNQPQEPWRFNNFNRWGGYDEIVKAEGTSDPWRFNADASLDISEDLMKLGSPGDILDWLLDPIRIQLKADIDSGTENGWELLMSLDGMSTVEFLSNPWPVDKIPTKPDPTKIPESALPPYNYDTIQWLETFNGGTNWYDQAFSETVLESMDFSYPVPDTDPPTGPAKWYCILGGAQQLAAKMESLLSPTSNNGVTYGSRVTSITQNSPMNVSVTITNTASPSASPPSQKTYQGVFTATPLGTLSQMDTTSANLNSAIRSATRTLGYGPSCKVGIKFTTPWWIYSLPKGNQVRRGGLGHSDLNLRTCVYPSYNIYDSASSPAVLLCSYTWQQDAQRLGALFASNAASKIPVGKDKDYNPNEDEALLKELLIDELAKLHSPETATQAEISDLRQTIADAYDTHFAWDWYGTPNAAGAFAFFRPEQFSSLWGKLLIPNGDVVVIGEHASPHHAWVVGALESAVHGIAAWCAVNEGTHKEFGDVLAVLKKPEAGNPFVGLPLYMGDVGGEGDEVPEGDGDEGKAEGDEHENMARWHGLLGLWARQEALEKREGAGTAEYGVRSETATKKERARAFLNKLKAEGRL